MRKLSFLVLSSALIAPAALAQEAAGPAGGILGQLIFFVPLILIFYFLLIRPQSQRAKKHRAMIEAVKKGDSVITAGGLIGKATKVTETEVTIELADGVRVKSVKSMLASVGDLNAPVAANDTSKK